MLHSKLKSSSNNKVVLLKKSYTFEMSHLKVNNLVQKEFNLLGIVANRCYAQVFFKYLTTVPIIINSFKNEIFKINYPSIIFLEIP